jgi:N-methylhydantoinase A
MGIIGDVDRARSAIVEHVARPLGIGLLEAAHAIVRLATEHMVHAIEEVTVEQGIDPRSAVLVAGGGASGFNIAAIAQRLRCSRLIMPETCAALSATGGLLSDVAVEAGAARYMDTARFDAEAVNATLEELEARCARSLEAAGLDIETARIERLADARYVSQVFEIEVPLAHRRFSSPDDVEALRETFHRLHEDVFAVRDADAIVEIVGWRVRAVHELERPSVTRLEDGRGAGVLTSREVYVPGEGLQEVLVLGTGALSEGRSIVGPAILELPATTLVVPTGMTAERDSNGSIVVLPPALVPHADLEVLDVRH